MPPERGPRAWVVPYSWGGYFRFFCCVTTSHRYGSETRKHRRWNKQMCSGSPALRPSERPPGTPGYVRVAPAVGASGGSSIVPDSIENVTIYTPSLTISTLTNYKGVADLSVFNLKDTLYFYSEGYQFYWTTFDQLIIDDLEEEYEVGNCVAIG